MALVPKPHDILLLPSFTLDSGSVLHSYILQSGFFLIITSYFNLEHFNPGLFFNNMQFDMLLY